MSAETKNVETVPPALFANYKVSKLIDRVDKHIMKNFKFEGIETRPANSNGLWCFTLIPVILLLYNQLYKVSELYRLMAYLSVGLLVYNILIILFLYISCLVIRDSYTSGVTISVLCATLPIYVHLEYDLIFSLVCSTILLIPYSFTLSKALIYCPKTFTIGEAMIVAQGVSLTFAACVINTYMNRILDLKQDKETLMIQTFVVAALLTVTLLSTALWFLKKEMKTLPMLLMLVAAGAAFALVKVHVVLGVGCLNEFLHYIFWDRMHLKLFMFWLFVTFLSIIIMLYCIELGLKASTSSRKTFHVTAALVFLSGILIDINFMSLASGIGLAVIIFVEALRLSGIEPVSSMLQTAFNTYADDKDVGLCAMTPIYLYVGLASPLLLVPRGPGRELDLLSGVLSIGIGDTAASFFGARYGINKWPGTNRTVEGTLGNILSQIIVVYALNMLELLQARHSIIRTVVAAIATGLVESQLGQVDNLILPLVAILAFQSTAYLA